MYFSSLKSQLPTQPADRASALVAINEWMSYFNVRWNHFEITGGKEILLTIKPVEHTGSDKFRALDIATRKCRYPDETQVRKGT